MPIEGPAIFGRFAGVGSAVVKGTRWCAARAKLTAAGRENGVDERNLNESVDLMRTQNGMQIAKRTDDEADRYLGIRLL